MKPKAEKPSKKEDAKVSKSQKPNKELKDEQLEEVAGGTVQAGWNLAKNKRIA